MERVDSKIALVTCTRNRGSRLDSYFEAVSRLKCDWPWDLVIVDNGSTDDTGERLKKFAATCPGRIKLVTELLPGLGRARNCGWRATNAPVIAFTDDDCYPEANFLNDVLTVFDDPAVGFSGGKILLYDASDARITIYEHPTEQIYPPGGFIVGGVIQGANMSFRRQALIDIDGFDNNIGSGTPFVFDDVDPELRALAAGWTGKYHPRAVVYHHHGRKPGKDVEALIRVYEDGRGAYYTKCILFMPQRWKCLRHWLRSVKQQPLGQTARELRSGIRYFFQLFKHKPNVTY
jgi:glycosyltransferase involved in cell wall biosynthesis